MKKITFAIIMVALVAVGVIFTFAQKGDGGNFGGRGFGGRGFGGHPFLKMAEKLNLSDEQKTQIKGILENSKTRVKPLMESMRENHQAIETLGTDGTYNEAEVTRLANAQAETSKQLVIEKEKTKAAIFAVLTPEQRTQAAAMKDQMKDRIKDRFKNRRGGKDMPDGQDE